MMPVRQIRNLFIIIAVFTLRFLRNQSGDPTGGT
jgi:hypothetical protein